jgi:hypothetical protein
MMNRKPVPGSGASRSPAAGAAWRGASQPRGFRRHRPISARDRAARCLAWLAAGLALALPPPPLAAQAPAENRNADAMLAAVDRNQVASSSHSAGTITVTDRYGTKTSAFESWTSGSERTLLAFTAGEEKGQKILRLKDTIYLSYPEADKPVKIQGAALRDSVAGSDFSYEDLNGERGYAGRYRPSLAGREIRGGVPCVILDLEARRPGLAYPYLKIWVAESDSSLRRMEEYAQNKRLLKSQEVLSVRTVAGKTIPVEMEMADLLKGKSRTLIRLGLVEWDQPVNPKLFSLEELSW